MTHERTAYIGLGSNLGERRANLEGALAALAEADGVSVRRVSDFLETAPVGGPPQGPYLNAVAELGTRLTVQGLLRLLQGIEERFGRARTVRWGPRTLDLDILLYGDRVIRQPDLEVPHPRLHERRFVLEPLCQIAPGVLHPVLRKTARELLRDLPEAASR